MAHRLIMAAFWVHDTDVEQVQDMLTAPSVPRVKGSGAVVSFLPKVVNEPGFRRLLCQLDLAEAADFEPEELDSNE